MEKPTPALLIAIAIALSLAAALHLSLWLDTACAVDSRRIVTKAAGGVGCFEFWLNRYQSLIGSILTAGVAGVTLVWLAKQLVAADRQVAAADRQAGAAAAQALRGLLPDFDLDKAVLQQIGSNFADARRRLAQSVEGNQWSPEFVFASKQADDIVSGLTGRLEELGQFQMRASTPALLLLSGRIGKVIADAMVTLEPVITIGQKYRAAEITEADLDNAVFEVAFAKADAIFESGTGILNDGMTEIFRAVEATWQLIRAAESAATGFDRVAGHTSLPKFSPGSTGFQST